MTHVKLPARQRAKLRPWIRRLHNAHPNMTMTKILPCMLALAVAGCVSTPTGPSVMVLPGSGKSYEEFRSDDYECRQYARSTVGTSTDQAPAGPGAKSADNLQKRYDNAYIQCMYARGNQVPMSGRDVAPPPDLPPR